LALGFLDAAHWSSDMKFTEAEAKAIMTEARANVAGAHADLQGMRWRDSPRIVTKTIDNARVPDPAPAEPAAVTMFARTDAGASDWSRWVDGRIAYEIGVLGKTLEEAIGEVIGNERRDFRQALRKRDDEIRALRRELKMLRDEVGLERGLANFKVEAEQARQQARDRELESLRRELATLRHEVEFKLNLKSELAAARAEIEDLRQRAPSFKAELEGLREKVAKQEKIIVRLRGEQSQLAYAQQQNSKEVTLTSTAVRLTAAIGEQTRENLQRLREETGFDLVEEMQSPSGLVS
jgi:hypothetical protein